MRKKCYSLVLSGIFLLMAPLEFCSGKENVSIMKQDEKLFESRHFDIEELADGVFAAIHKDGGAAICNAGIIDLGDRTLIFDSFLTPQAARDLKAASEALTGKAVSIVINSHCHNDHIWGNQVFEGHAEIISSGETRQVIATAGMKEYEWFKENAAKRLKSIQDEYESNEDEAARGELTMWLSYYQGLVDDLPELRVVQPTLTFEGRFGIPGTRRSVELIEYHDGHTKSDVILYLPQDGIIFMGDLLFVKSHPYLGDGEPDTLINILREIGKMDAKVFVPGHGSVGDKHDLEILINYIALCRELVKKLIDDGQGEEAIRNIKIPRPFESWQQQGFFRSNLLHFYKNFSDK